MPIWQVVLLALLPWIPILTMEIRWTYRHYGWLALFYFLTITQLGHFIEPVCQMYQIHVLHLKGPKARGVFGQLDIEWVHFIWNSWIIVAAGLLAHRFRRKPWLWVTLLIAGWHEVEHLYIMSVYLRTGQAGTPGLLSDGGIIGGGLSMARADLHFVYNLIETAPLLIGFVWQLGRTHDAWLAKAFPLLTRRQLAYITTRVRTVKFAQGETFVSQDRSGGSRAQQKIRAGRRCGA